mgnify:CR=1 FL=1
MASVADAAPASAGPPAVSPVAPQLPRRASTPRTGTDMPGRATPTLRGTAGDAPSPRATPREAVSALDVSVQARLLDLMRNLVSELGLAAIVVTHDLAVARLLSHRVMVMKGGRVIETGLTDQVLDDPREPYTQLLVSSILPP